MAQTILYVIGGITHAIVLRGRGITSLEAKGIIQRKIESTPVDFNREARPSLEEQLDAELSNAGVTDIQIIEH